LVVGVNVANRSLSSAKRTTGTDTFTRVLNAAEGGIELAVAASTTDLDNLVGDTEDPECNVVFGNASSNEGTDGCLIPYADSLTEALVTVSPDKGYDETTPFEAQLDNPGTVLEVRLDTYQGDDVKLCWGQEHGDATQDAKATALYYIVYGTPSGADSSVVARMGLQYEPNSNGLNLSDEAFVAASNASFAGASGFVYEACKDISVTDDIGGQEPYGLRIKSTHRPTRIAVAAVGNNDLPAQGHKIVSVGRLTGATGAENITKTVTAKKTFSFLPAIFDYAIYMHEGSLTKGN